MAIMTDEEKEGVKMIIALQAVINIVEPEERALAAWRNFTTEQKESTHKFYDMIVARRFSNA